MKCPKVTFFDLDDTLAESFKPPSRAMLERFDTLLGKMPLAILTAAGFPRINQDFLVPLANTNKLTQLYIFPDSSARCYLYVNGVWEPEYSLMLSDEDRVKIKAAIQKVAMEQHFDGILAYKPQIIDREAQIAYAFLGLDAPDDLKRTWDPTFEKRAAMQQALLKIIPEYDILIGGRSTIDITTKGVNKSYGVNWLSHRLHTPPQDMLFVGDALYEGGNDFVVIPTGIKTRPVTGPSETLGVIDEILAACSA